MPAEGPTTLQGHHTSTTHLLLYYCRNSNFATCRAARPVVFACVAWVVRFRSVFSAFDPVTGHLQVRSNLPASMASSKLRFVNA